MSAQMKDRPTLLGMAAAFAIGCVLLVFAAKEKFRVVMPHGQEFYSGWFVRHIRGLGANAADRGRLSLLPRTGPRTDLQKVYQSDGKVINRLVSGLSV